MGCGDHIKRLLRPLGVYKLENSLSSGEIAAVGSAYDGAEEGISAGLFALDAEKGELSRLEELLPIVNFGTTEADRRKAVKTLLRPQGSRKAALESALDACGLTAEITEEEEPFTVSVRFTEVRGELSDGEERLCRSIMPAHLRLKFYCGGLTWDRAETLFPVWDELDNCGLTVSEIMKLT